MESTKQRSARRAISAWLTRQINTNTNGNGYPAVRATVLQALQDLNTRFTELNESLPEKYFIKEGSVLVKFYMKGGNAFECVLEPEGSAATQFGGGQSDWDTQVIVDPWAPLPLQDIVYGLIEEIVTDEMVKAGVAIAENIGDFVTTIKEQWSKDRTDIAGENYCCYDLEYDEPQTLRQIFDRDRIGLWTNNRRKVSDPGNTHSDRIPGIVLNEAIRPFALYRLGYTWHALGRSPCAERPTSPPENMVEPEDVGEIKRPALMELIDVTLPRRDTIEAVAVWEELEQKHIVVTSTHVTVANVPSKAGAISLTKKLPLPDIMYHLREIATMLCEIADGSSRHADKLARRFQRFKMIWENSGDSEKEKIKQTLSAFAGVPDILHDPPANNDYVTQEIKKCPGSIQQEILEGNDYAFTLARNLMDRIANRHQAVVEDKKKNTMLTRFDEARKDIREWVDCVVAALQGEISLNIAVEAAYSDDLVLMRYIQENEYLNAERVGFSGVDRAVVIRVVNHIALDALANTFRILLDKRYSGSEDHHTSVHFREHNTPRANGITYEQTMVVFQQGRAGAYITLTTATNEEAPFRPDPGDASVRFASLQEIAVQRKVAAALIQDYLIRTTISRQYEALKTLLPSI
jgi:hypothetical protein